MKALVLIDLQNDFLPGGSLPVPNGHVVIPVANRLMEVFDLIVATQDWHPHNHLSFAENHPENMVGEKVELDGVEQILWPVHCVQNTKGAEFAPGLQTDKFIKIVHKGTDKKIDSYSAFFDNAHLKKTELDDFLKERGVTKVYLMGLATEYCVLHSVLDAIELGYEVFVVRDGCRGIDLFDGDVKKAFALMEEKGAHILSSEEIVNLHE